MATDPLNDVRNIRRKISHECGDDPERVFDYYQKHQEEMKRSGRFRFVNTRMENVHAAPATEQTDEPEPE